MASIGVWLPRRTAAVPDAPRDTRGLTEWALRHVGPDRKVISPALFARVGRATAPALHLLVARPAVARGAVW